jgi:hypothetical protein
MQFYEILRHYETDLDAVVPAALDVHVICDNLSAHKASLVQRISGPAH